MTIKDIARLSGVGVGTVSRVLNHHPDVSEATRKKVLAVVEEQGFQPNRNAKHLKQQTPTSVAIVVKGTQNVLFADLVERIQALLRDAGQDAAVYYLDEEANEVAYAVRLCRERTPRGLLFLGGDLEFFRAGFGQIKTPSVLLTNTAEQLGFADLSSVTTDDREAACRAVEYLMDRGHRCIGVLGGNDSSTQISYRRLQGCRKAFRERAVDFDSGTACEPCRYSMEEAYTAARRLVERQPRLTAIFAMSDLIALGAVRALGDLGRRVPEDISVVGFDGLPITRYFLPRLTTVHQDTQQMARRGVDILLRSMARRCQPVHEVIPFQLIEGESVAAPSIN